MFISLFGFDWSSQSRSSNSPFIPARLEGRDAGGLGGLAQRSTIISRVFRSVVNSGEGAFNRSQAVASHWLASGGPESLFSIERKSIFHHYHLTIRYWHRPPDHAYFFFHMIEICLSISFQGRAGGDHGVIGAIRGGF